jgi:serine/threonine protein kinase
MGKLRHYYECDLPKLDTLGSAIRSDTRLPWYSRYHDLAGSVEHNITYSHHMPDKLLFFGESDGNKVCVKFTTSYSREVHAQCASMGIAPTLRGFEVLPGGWFMVVMDRIDDVFTPSYASESSLTIELHNLVLKHLTLLHQARYVHGDLRDTNLMVRKDGQPGFMLVDFDWAGEIGEVCYPMNVNTDPELGRPAGAYDGEIIQADHDIDMLRKIFDGAE